VGSGHESRGVEGTSAEGQDSLRAVARMMMMVMVVVTMTSTMIRSTH
jgi:hypothetical protein